MNEPAILVIWIIGLFGLIGVVVAAVARLVIRDSLDYDRRYIWRLSPDKEYDKKP